MISGSLWNYYRDEIDGVNDDVSEGKLTEIFGRTLVRPSRLAQLPPRGFQMELTHHNRNNQKYEL